MVGLFHIFRTHVGHNSLDRMSTGGEGGGEAEPKREREDPSTECQHRGMQVVVVFFKTKMAAQARQNNT